MLTFDEILKLDDRLLALYQEATAYRVLIAGAPGRICHYGVKPQVFFGVAQPSPQERAAKWPRDPEYCGAFEWQWKGDCALPARGEIGLKYLVSNVIDSNGSLQPYRDGIMQKFRDDMTPCQHEGDCPGGCTPVPPRSTDPHTHSFSRGERIEGGKIISDPPFSDLLSMMEGKPKPMPGLSQQFDGICTKWTHTLPKDEGDPCYIVLSEWEAHRLASELEYSKRFDAGVISERYLKHSIYVCGPQQRDLLLSDDLTKRTMTGYLAYKNVVLTFADRDLEHKLASVCHAVATILPIAPKVTPAIRQRIAERPDVSCRTDEELQAMGLPRWFPPLQAMRAPFQSLGVISDTTSEISDMPAEVLDGWLGELCRSRMSGFPIAYAWPALLSAASVLVPKCGSRTNLYVGIVGPPGSGKSSAFDYAFELLGLKEPTLQRLKAGSAEGLSQYIGDVDGAARLFFPDELSHLLKKASIEGSTFPQFLNTMYYHDQQESTIAHQKLLKMKCRLSIAGGIPEEQFNEDFGAETTHGLYDRFMLSLCPTGFQYNYRPFDGEPAFNPSSFADEDAMTNAPSRPVAVSVDPSVWRALDDWRSSGIDGRSVEAAVRAAVICAAFDTRGVLRAEALRPALALAKYQSRIRQMLTPNPGKNTGGILTSKIRTYLQNNAPSGEWIFERPMLKKIHAWDFGAGAAEREMQALSMSGEIERAKHGRAKVCRLDFGGTE